jgi:hypothetical protein
MLHPRRHVLENFVFTDLPFGPVEQKNAENVRAWHWKFMKNLALHPCAFHFGQRAHGPGKMQSAYRHAIKRGDRFYSHGDSSLLLLKHKAY